MPDAPEVQHLKRAVDLVKTALLPEKKKEPTKDEEPEPDFENQKGGQLAE